MTRRLKKYNTQKKKSHKRIMRGGRLTLEILLFLYNFHKDHKFALKTEEIRKKLDKYIKKTSNPPLFVTQINDNDIGEFIKYMHTPTKEKELILRKINKKL